MLGWSGMASWRKGDMPGTLDGGIRFGQLEKMVKESLCSSEVGMTCSA